MEHFSWFLKKALSGVIPGVFFILTVATVTYALTYNWSDPSSIRNRSVGNPLTSSGWNLLVGNVDNLNERVTSIEWISGIPTGAVMSFNLANCPSGWLPADGGWTPARLDLRGEFIRGWDNGKGLDIWRTLGSAQSSTTIGSRMLAANLSGNQGEIIPSLTNVDSTTPVGSAPYQISTSFSTSQSANQYGIRPRNIALLYCIKN